ncbi:membrane integrity-associated transporter subunit PqiC [candidate division KSB1 bacterium]|nr:membrane integrity-associated transporter subunit PqiC [candidate division KSB1 bacterium]
MKTTKLLFLLLCTTFLLNCGSRTTLIRKYYLLESKLRPDTDLMGITEPFAVNAEIRDFRIALPYQDARIPLRSDDNELIYYYFHYWAVRPSEAVTRFVHDLTLQCNIFQRCSRTATDHADVIISGEIRSMERVRVRRDEYAHVSGVFLLTDGKTGKILIEYDFNRRMELKKKKTMNDFAELVSTILFYETEEFLFRVADLYLYPQG